MVRRPVESCCAPQDASDGPTAPRALGNAVEHDPEHHDRETRGQALPEEVAPGEPGDHVVAERAAAEVLALPIYPELTAEQQQYVAAKVTEFYRRG